MNTPTKDEKGKPSASLFSLNESASQAFGDIAKHLQLKGENPFKIKAYIKASSVLRELDEDLEVLCQRGELRSIAGVGKAIADKLEAFIKTGSIPQLEALREEIPQGLLTLAALPGLGAKKTLQLHQELAIVDMAGLHSALSQGKVAELKGFTKKSQEKLLVAVEKSLQQKVTFVRKRLSAWANKLTDSFSTLPEIRRVEVAGELRRLCAESDRLELVLGADNVGQARKAVEQHLRADALEFELEGAELSFTLPSGCPVSLTICLMENFCWELLRRTGPNSFVDNFTGLAQQAWESELELFQASGKAFVEPEFRHREKPWSLPAGILEITQIKGNLHAHSTYSDGQNSLEEMVGKARGEGHQFFGISDHSRSLVIANGLSIERLEEQFREIEKLRLDSPEFHLFSSVECDILDNGSLDYPDEVLQNLDYVVAAVHSFFHLSEVDQTARILRGLSHPKVRIWAHPTGRLLTKRDGYKADWVQLFEHCASENIALEINASPWRVDISEELLELALTKGCLIAINTDAHSVEEFSCLKYGVDAARRCAVLSSQVVNTWSVEKLRHWFDTGQLS